MLQGGPVGTAHEIKTPQSPLGRKPLRRTAHLPTEGLGSLKSDLDLASSVTLPDNERLT